MITIKKLNKSYGKQSVLKNLNLNLEKGDIYGFLGNNGAGKTTTLNIINQLISHNSGSVIVEGTIGYLPENPVFYDYMSAKEYLRFIGELKGNVSDQRIKQLLEQVNLKSKKKIGSFSRGMKQRLGLAASIYHEPEIILLDEPSSALDPEGRKDMLAIIETLNAAGKTIMLSSHILDDIERICNRIGVLKDGHLIYEASKEALLAAEVDTYVIESDTLSEKDVLTLASVENVKRISGQFEIISDNPDFFHEIATLNHTIISFNRKQHTLEDIFVRMVNHDN